MQIFEILLYVEIIGLLGILILKTTMNIKVLISIIGISFITLTLHLFNEFIRWQTIPIYICLIFVSLIMVLLNVKQSKLQFKKIRVFTLFMGILLIVLSGISSYVFPVYSIPEPTGDLLVGTESFVFVDDNRNEYYGDEENRRIKVQFWYPTDTIEGYDPVPWLEDGKVVAQSVAKDNGLPSFSLNHTALIMSNSYSKAPLSNTSNSYPVVIISHGWRGFKNLHTDLAEDLASKGYIVLGIDHTYGSVATVFGEDDVAYVNHDALPNKEETTDYFTYSNALVSTYADDVSFTLDILEQIENGEIPSQFEGKIELNNIGHLGHSTGGGAGVQVAIRDDRIKAVFGMDSWVEPIEDTLIQQGLNIPCLFIRSESWQTGTNNINLDQLVDDNIGNTRLYQLKYTTHYDFSMAYMYSPLTDDLGMTGDLEGEYLVSIYRSMMTDFFDQTLKVNNNVGLIIINDEWAELYIIR